MTEYENVAIEACQEILRKKYAFTEGMIDLLIAKGVDKKLAVQKLKGLC